MDMFNITGGQALHGTVSVDGSKNASLPILAATLGIFDTIVLARVPQLQDVMTMRQLLQCMGAEIVENPDASLTINTGAVKRSIAPYELVRQMRASVCVLGPLLARFGFARVSLPGGCQIGHRPIDIHLRGLAALGADIRLESGYVVAECRSLRAAEMDLNGANGPTVTGTCNVMMAAALARGRSVLHSAALEPEVADLGRFLNSAGAQISGLGTSTLEIEGVESLHSVRHEVISDRIEAATLATAAAITRGNVLIEGAPAEQMTAVLETLNQIGVAVENEGSGIRVKAGSELRAVRIRATPYPGLPTDMQAQLTALLTIVPGDSRIVDSVFPDRFMHAAELERLGADIRIQGNAAFVRGVARLSGAPLMASDLRASAALVLAALVADGRTEIRRVYHLDRGYHAFERKLNALGACIERTSDQTSGALVPAPHLDLAGNNVAVRIKTSPTRSN
jgi:UDP-N-acetylglucosamine 1-carboxyvinyltransferase